MKLWDLDIAMMQDSIACETRLRRTRLLLLDDALTPIASLLG
jgi:hypothetical protein